MSTQVAWFEKPASASWLVVAPTVIAFPAFAGETVQAVCGTPAPFPAATATK